jgi:hypothetical protein
LRVRAEYLENLDRQTVEPVLEHASHELMALLTGGDPLETTMAHYVRSHPAEFFR